MRNFMGGVGAALTTLGDQLWKYDLYKKEQEEKDLENRKQGIFKAKDVPRFNLGEEVGDPIRVDPNPTMPSTPAALAQAAASTRSGVPPLDRSLAGDKTGPGGIAPAKSMEFRKLATGSETRPVDGQEWMDIGGGQMYNPAASLAYQAFKTTHAIERADADKDYERNVKSQRDTAVFAHNLDRADKDKDHELSQREAYGLAQRLGYAPKQQPYNPADPTDWKGLVENKNRMAEIDRQGMWGVRAAGVRAAAHDDDGYKNIKDRDRFVYDFVKQHAMPKRDQFGNMLPAEMELPQANAEALRLWLSLHSSDVNSSNPDVRRGYADAYKAFEAARNQYLQLKNHPGATFDSNNKTTGLPDKAAREADLERRGVKQANIPHILKSEYPELEPPPNRQDSLHPSAAISGEGAPIRKETFEAFAARMATQHPDWDFDKVAAEAHRLGIEIPK